MCTPYSQAVQLEHVDIRDHINEESSHKEISKIIFEHAINNPCDFITSFSDCPNGFRYYENGPLGPEGYESSGRRFEVTSSNSETRENTIYSIEISNHQQLKADGALLATLQVFIQNSNQYPSSGGFFFKKIKTKINLRVKELEILDHTLEVPLKDTHFSFYSDATNRKTIIVDEVNNFLKVIPIATGAFDIRTLEGMDGFVGSMTEDLVDNAMIHTGQPGGLYRARNYQAFYKARPFLGVANKGGTDYKSASIAWHYQIEKDFLRGFITHGCMRTRDKDLYQLSSIVFNSNKAIPVKVVQSFKLHEDLKKFHEIKHPTPKYDDKYYVVNYYPESYLDPENLEYVTTKSLNVNRTIQLSEIERHQWCIRNNETPVSNGVPDYLRFFPGWASALDSYCLTKTSVVESGAEEILNYIKEPDSHPEPNFTPSLPNHPIVRNAVIENQNICELSLTQAIREFNSFESPLDGFTNEPMTFNSYAANCGCSRLREILDTTLIKIRGVFLSPDEKNEHYSETCGLN